MKQSLKSIIIIIILMLAVLIVPVFSGASMMDLPDGDDLPDIALDEDDFSLLIDVPMSWIRIPVHQMLVLFGLGISIFTLFVVYLGGRSKHRRFNDRTLDPINLLLARALKTALLLVEPSFNFRFFNISSFSTVRKSDFYPVLVPTRRSKRL